MEIVFYNHILEKISLNTQFAQAIFFEMCKTKLVLYFIITKSSIYPLILSVNLKTVSNGPKLDDFLSIFL